VHWAVYVVVVAYTSAMLLRAPATDEAEDSEKEYVPAGL